MPTRPVVITIEKLKLRCLIGVLPHERATKQEVIITAKITLADHRAALSDDLNDTVDYGLLAEKITNFVETSSFHLIERLAYGILEILLANPKVTRGDVKVEKPGTFALRFADTVAIELSGDKDAG